MDPMVEEEKVEIALTKLTSAWLPFFKSVTGEWTKEKSRGTYRILTDQYQAFMKNPGFWVRVEETTKLLMNLWAEI